MRVKEENDYLTFNFKDSCNSESSETKTILNVWNALFTIYKNTIKIFYQKEIVWISAKSLQYDDSNSHCSVFPNSNLELWTKQTIQKTFIGKGVSAAAV